MARIANPEVVTPAVIKALPHLCIYKMEGEWHVRTRSSLTRKSVKTHPAFLLTRVYSGLLGQAAKLASVVYKQLPRAQKNRKLYREMVGVAMQGLKVAVAPDDITLLLEAQFLPARDTITATPTRTRRRVNRARSGTLKRLGVVLGTRAFTVPYVPRDGHLRGAGSVSPPSPGIPAPLPSPGSGRIAKMKHIVTGVNKIVLLTR